MIAKFIRALNKNPRSKTDNALNKALQLEQVKKQLGS